MRGWPTEPLLINPHPSRRPIGRRATLSRWERGSGEAAAKAFRETLKSTGPANILNDYEQTGRHEEDVQGGGDHAPDTRRRNGFHDVHAGPC